MSNDFEELIDSPLFIPRDTLIKALEVLGVPENRAVAHVSIEPNAVEITYQVTTDTGSRIRNANNEAVKVVVRIPVQEGIV